MHSQSLNHIYRLVWNAVTQTWVAVAEVTRGRSKPGKSRKARRAHTRGLALAAALMATGAAQANPAGGVVTSGVGKISQSANSTVIQQQSQNLQLQWQSFNVGAGQSVTFQQPSANSLAVNQILDTNGSRILGNIHANGQVWLINPNGVFFGKDAQVNVGGLVASTLNPMGTAADGSQSFAKLAGSATGSVVNEGRLTAAEGGYIALLGEQVRNQGVISAQLGSVALAGGSAVSLNFSGHQLLGVEVTQSTLDNLASNQQLIQANGGQVFMSAGAKDSLLASAVNNSGTIEAQTIQEKNGRIILMAGMAAGTTTVAGKLDASAPNGGNGGFVETSASVVKVAGDAVVTTKAAQGKSGTWLLDPTDFNIDAGTGASTSSSIGADTLSANLANGNVTIQTVNNIGTDKGDINVNADVSWSTNNTLTLSAYRDIVFNASLTATGAAGKVALEYGQGAVAAGNTATYDFGMTNNNSFTARINLKEGDNFSTKLGSDGSVVQYKVITRLGSSTDTAFNALTPIHTLQGMSSMKFTHFVLGADIDASATSGWNGGQGFSPLGPGDANSFPNFYGGFDGLGHIITGLTINRPNSDYQGLFTRKGPNTFAEGFPLRNVGLVDASVTGRDYVGILAAEVVGQVTNVFATGNVSARRLAGGLAGTASLGPVSWGLAYVDSVYAKVNVTGVVPHATELSGNLGGLFGQASGGGPEGTINIRRAYATGNVTATDGQGVGGLIGASTARIADTFASGNVTGLDSNTPDMFGGLRKSYYVGGLVGRRATGSSVVNSYSRGVVSASSTVGGLVGGDVPNQSQSVTNSFWDTQASGLATSPAGTGKTTAEMQARATFADAGWNIEGQGGAYPVLTLSRTAATTWLIGLPATRVTYSLSPITGYTYSGQAVELGSLWNAGSIFGNTYSSWALGTDYSFSFGGNAVTGFTNAGSYSNIGVNVLNSAFAAANTGNTKGSLVIAPKAVTVSGLTVADKAYDGGTTATVNTAGAVYTGLVTGEALSTTATGSFASKNASATAQTVTLSATTSAGANTLLSNYTVAEQASTTARITPKAVTVSGITAANKAYDGNTTATVNTASAVYTGLAAGEAMSTTATGSFASKNASATAQSVTLSATTSAGANTSLDNYTVTEQASTSARITPKAVTVSGITATDKAYDGSTTATVNTAGAVYTGLVTGEALSTAATGSFASKDASATAQTVTLAATTTAGANTSLSNYTVTEQANTTAKINKKAVTVSGITAANKAYDGSTTATVNTASAVYTGLVTGEAMSTTASGSFASKDASATAQNVSLAATTTAGANTSLSNYTVAEQTSTTARITPKAVTVSGITATDKAYDGSTTATVNTAGAVFTGLLAGEALSTTATGNFASKNASATAQTVTLAATTSAGANTSLSNYTVTEQANTTAKITPKAVTVSGLTVANKAYDGSSAAAVNTSGAVYNGLVAGEAMSTIATGSFAGKDASATVQAVSLSATTTAGANTSLANYTVTEQTSTTARITPKAVTVSGLTVADKAYDGSTAVAVNTSGAVYNGLVAGEAMSTTATGSFASKNASAAAQIVTLAATTTAGANTNLANYSVTEQTSATARVTPKAVTVSGIAVADKTYDGGTTATVDTSNAKYEGLVAGETLSTAASGVFDNKIAADNKTVMLTATTTAGPGTLLSNYQVTVQASASTSIHKKVLTVAGTASDKVYDSTSTAGVTLTAQGVVAGDKVLVNRTGADFVDGQGVPNGNVGTNKSVVVTGVSLSGSDSANYSLGSLVNVDAKASISPATLTYVAAPTSVILGQPLQLTGSVTGLVGRDTLADALTGTAVWTIDGDMNVPGTKGVVGGGLSAKAGNYVFRQAQGNGAGLEVKPGSAPLQVQAITTNLQRGQGNLPTQLTTGHGTQAPSRSAYLPPALSTDPGRGTLQVVNRGLNVPTKLLIGTDE